LLRSPGKPASFEAERRRTALQLTIASPVSIPSGMIDLDRRICRGCLGLRYDGGGVETLEGTEVAFWAASYLRIRAYRESDRRQSGRRHSRRVPPANGIRVARARLLSVASRSPSTHRLPWRPVGRRS
jgi:hypothetical protein